MCGHLVVNSSVHKQVTMPSEIAFEMSMQVLAYNLKRVISILGMSTTLKAMKLAGG